NIHLPPMRQHSKATAGEDQAVSAAFLSDVHVGSKTFLAPQWEKMIQWFNSDPLGEEHRIEMDKLRSSMPNLALKTNAPYGSRIKIKQQVAKEFNITEQDVENIWKYFRKNYPDLI
ncbi:MAG: hypothetical protein EBW42_11975, partial [Rhodobacterales bacterium]|nr:hypothetical protein [Rhodobacterales bacterium]